MAIREKSLLITKAKFNGYDEFNYYDEQRLLRLVSNNGPVEKMSRGVDQTDGSSTASGGKLDTQNKSRIENSNKE
jgi:hypothetical protein